VAIVSLLLASASPAPLWAQASEGGEATSRLAPAAQAIVDRINGFSEKDLTADPQADLDAQQALRIDAEARDDIPLIDLSTLYSNIGGSYFYLRDYDQAIAWMDKAADFMARGGGDPSDIAGLHNNLGAILGNMNRLAEAEDHHRQALALRRSIEGERGPAVGSSLFGLGYVLFRQGKIEEALPLLASSAEMQLEFGKPGDPLTVMRVASLASVQTSAGRLEEAVATAREAVRLGNDTLGIDHPVTGIAYNNLGNALIETGQYADTIPILRETLRLRAAKDGADSSGVAYAMKNLATALQAVGKIDEAETMVRAAADTWRRSGESENPGALAYMDVQAAELAKLRGDEAERARLLDAAIADIAAKVEPDNNDLAYIRALKAEQLLDSGQPGAALALLEQALPAIETALLPDHGDRLQAEFLHGEAVYRSGDKARGFALADSARQRLQASMLDAATSRYDLINASTKYGAQLGRFIDLALDSGHADAAFAALQLVNLTDLAVAYADSAARLAAGDGERARMAAEIQQSARQARVLRQRQAKAIEAKDAAQLATIEGEIAANRAQLSARQADFATKYPDSDAIGRPEPVALTAFAAGLAPGEAIIAPVRTQRGLVVMRITRDGVSSVRSALTLAEIGDDIDAIRASIDDAMTGSSDGFASDAAYRLYRALFPEGIGGARRITLYGGGKLATIPLGLLLTAPVDGDLRDAPWLVREAAFDVAARLVVRDARAAARSSAAARFVGIGAPVLGGSDSAAGGIEYAGLFRGGSVELAALADLPALPAATAELSRMRDAIDAKGLLLTGARASERTIKATDLSHASVIAFATHGLVSGELRGLSQAALVLTPPAAASDEDDGLLTASEIADLDLHADWIILSACNTASSGSANEPLFSGLAQAFTQAGARSLLLSHWRVRDDAAARLTVDTVRGAGSGLDRAQALRAAQLALIADADVAGGAHPAIWAPFILIGD